MKERLIQLLDLEQLTPSKFADIIGVQRSSISHVISGRNKPSFDFLQKTLRAFPGLNASWLLLGEGTMYEQMGRNVSGNLFSAPGAAEEPSEAHISDQEKPSGQTDMPEDSDKLDEKGIQLKEDTGEAAEKPGETAAMHDYKPEEVLNIPATGQHKRILQVLIIYSDDTFRSIYPGN